MLRSLMADRFRLVLHREAKERPVYNHVAAKSGIKIATLKEGSCIVANPQKPPTARPGDPPPRLCNNLHVTRGGIEAAGVDMTRLANTLAAILNRTVVNKTAFTGMFDLQLEYAPVDISGCGSAASSDPSIFTALQDKLRLRLESSKGPIEMLVIDNVERPSEN
jgi:uncharacterized protein (TIGR03435 family)